VEQKNRAVVILVSIAIMLCTMAPTEVLSATSCASSAEDPGVAMFSNEVTVSGIAKCNDGGENAIFISLYLVYDQNGEQVFLLIGRANNCGNEATQSTVAVNGKAYVTERPLHSLLIAWIAPGKTCNEAAIDDFMDYTNASSALR
jgi:hypothetical protein